ncbi:unnamed protein product [Lymnaea stagnalis]|uniref:Uncharacterized protein n=1 Tax=Lymnaea stagnalis TaxID=6523 RepID=A0AAV2H8V5_LYMST
MESNSTSADPVTSGRCVYTGSDGSRFGVQNSTMCGQGRAVSQRANDKESNEDAFKYRGIASNKGNIVFTDTPVAPPSYRHVVIPAAACYGRPIQNPMYKTTNADYGQQPSPSHIPIQFFPRDQSFTARQSLGGVYEDTHLTTETDKEII